MDKSSLDDKDRIIANLTSQITNLAARGGKPATQSTIGTEAHVRNITSMEEIGDNGQRIPVTGGNPSFFDESPEKFRRGGWN